MNEKYLAPVQIYAVVICLIINILDGFDILAIAFAANEISIEWEISAVNLGILFSSGLVGMIFGAFLLAPIADTFGRRPQIALCLIIIAFGMLASGFSATVTELMILRFITGIGIGGILPSINTMVSEYSGSYWRNLCLSLMHIGYPLGVVVGGISAVFLIGEHGWRSIFIFGGGLTFLAGLAVMFFLPESLAFLLTKQPKGALDKANALLVKLKQPTLDALPQTEYSNKKVYDFSLLFSKKFLLPSILLWTGFFMCMMTHYFLLNWMPKILIDAGLSTEVGISSGVIMSIGGMVGMLVLGIISTRMDLVKTVQIYFAMALVAIIGFGIIGLNLNLLLTITFILGFFLYGAIIGLYMIGAWLYPPSVRNTGVGWAIGIGRFGAVLGPYLAGIFIETGMEKWLYFSIFAIPLLICIFAMGMMNVRTSEVSQE